MIKFPALEQGTADKGYNQVLAGKIILSDQYALNESQIIPIDGQLVVSPLSTGELGKQMLKAAADGDVEEIKQLLSKGAPFTADWLGTSPLHLAAQGNHLDVCELLLRSGISKDSRTKVDRTPLHVAAYEGHLRIVELLLRSGADPNCIDLLKMTPLHWAAQNGHAEVVLALLKNGSSPHSMNKFDLTPVDIANQINRPDIAEIIQIGSLDPTIATENLAIELAAAENCDEPTFMEERNNESINTDMTVQIENAEGNSISDERLRNKTTMIDPDKLLNQPNSNGNNTNNTNNDQDVEVPANAFSESLKILEQHGITMLPADDSSILNSVMESGHSVVLTDVGKEVLNSVKVSEPIQTPTFTINQVLKPVDKRKFITVTPDEFLALTNSANKNILRQVNGKLVPKSLKRIVMKKNRVVPFSSHPTEANKKEISIPTDMETVMTQLIEARKTIEEYKLKLMKKDQELETYKQQIRLLMESR